MKRSEEKNIAIGIFCGLAVFLGLGVLLMCSFQGLPVSQLVAGLSVAALCGVMYVLYRINVGLKSRVTRERELAASAYLYDHAPCGYLTVDPERNILRINQTLLEWLGYSENEVVGKFKFESFLSAETRTAYMATYHQAFEKYKNEKSIRGREFDFQRKDRTIFNVTLSSVAKYADDGTYLEGWSTVVDSTERKRTEQEIIKLNQNLESTVEARTHELAQSEKIYRSLAANIPGSAITLLDRDERYMLAEGEMLRKMGYQKETMPGMRISDIITPENYEFYGPVIKKAFAGEQLTMEKRTLSGFDTQMNVVPLRNERDEIFAVMFVYIDVSDFKEAQAELKKLNNTLENKVFERTQQLNELNQELESFTYSVSHDLRAPLRAISGYARMLSEDYADIVGTEGQRMIELVISNGVRMGKLIDDLLEFSRLGRKPLTRAKVNMEELVKEVMSELTPEQKGAKATVDILPLGYASADRSMIKQVWVNLISNALKYSSRKERPLIKIMSEHTDGEVCYSISDNGAGFNMEYADKLFNVFQRLHKINDFEGTGVGLALVKTIVKKHGGKVSAEGKPDQGATFRFTLHVEPINNE